jgi:hypothetical protein
VAVGSKSRAAVANRILASAAGEVGWGQRLGKHGKVGNSIEVHRGGEAHRSEALDGGGGSVEGLTGARP